MPEAAQAQVGRRNFIEPLVAEDANPSNELDMIPQWVKLAHGSLLSVSGSFEKQLSRNFSIELGSGWNDPSCQAHRACSLATVTRIGRHRQRRITSQLLSGFQDLEVLTKYAFFESAAHEVRLAMGTDMFFGAGNPSAGASTHTFGGPIFMFSKGMGDIPDSAVLRYLKPFAIQGDMEDLMRTGGTQSNQVISDAVISYQLSYLSDYVRDIGLPAPIRDLSPFAEFTYDQYIKGGRGATQPDLRILPGVAYVNGPVQVSVATGFSLNQVDTQAMHAAAYAMLSLTLDQMIPEFGWTPL